jgi:hypothetical protein
MQPTTVHCETSSWFSSHLLAASFSISRSALFSRAFLDANESVASLHTAEVLKAQEQGLMTAKAYCGRVITEWLSHELILAANGPLRGNEEIRLACVTVMLDPHAGCN